MIPAMTVMPSLEHQMFMQQLRRAGEVQAPKSYMRLLRHARLDI